MKFSDLAKYLEKLDVTTKRLEITDILADLIRQLDESETKVTTYLILGFLRAPFEGLKFNIADKMMLKILEAAVSMQKASFPLQELQKMYKSKGDLGNVANEIIKKEKSPLLILEVYDKLENLAKASGSGSQEQKIKIGSALIKELDSLSAKYVTRMILGTTRLGFTELTMVDALALVCGDKKLSPKIEAVYNLHPDMGLIAWAVKKHGILGLSKIKMETGVPVMCQKAQRFGSVAETMEKMKLVWAEYKFDGTRVQLHLDRNKNEDTGDQVELFDSGKKKFLIKTYTRNLEETSHQYPDIAEAAAKQIKADSVILDGEAIGYNKKSGEFLPFQETIQRKRKHDIEQAVIDVPLKYFVFDILYLNGKPLIDLTLRERKKILKTIITPGETLVIDEYMETSDTAELQKYFELARDKGLEGLIAKNPNGLYQAGARSYSWVKLKNADEKLLRDSLDCVVLGYYAGKGLRSTFGIGGFLVGIYDKSQDKFKTITKIGTGLTEEDWGTLKKLCDKNKITKLPANVEANKIYQPDVVVKPVIVVEVGADEISESHTHTAGYALRFPRLLKFRQDKNATQATTLDEIKNIYKLQARGKY